MREDGSEISSRYLRHELEELELDGHELEELELDGHELEELELEELEQEESEELDGQELEELEHNVVIVKTGLHEEVLLDLTGGSHEELLTGIIMVEVSQFRDLLLPFPDP